MPRKGWERPPKPRMPLSAVGKANALYAGKSIADAVKRFRQIAEEAHWTPEQRSHLLALAGQCNAIGDEIGGMVRVASAGLVHDGSGVRRVLGAGVEGD